MAGITNPRLAENIATQFGIMYEANTPAYPADRMGTFSYTPRGSLIPNHSYLSFAETLVKQWMSSPGHRDNILSRNALQLGCGAYFYPDKDFYDMPKFKAVQNFQLYKAILPGKAIDRDP